MKIFHNLLTSLPIVVIATDPSFSQRSPALRTPEISAAKGMGSLAFLGDVIAVIRGRVRL